MLNRSTMMKTVVTTLLLIMGSLLFADGSTTLVVSRPMLLGSDALSAGEYRMQWTSAGETTTVTLARDGKVVASAKGRIVNRDVKHNRMMIVSAGAADGTSTIIEIRLAGQKQAILFRNE